jgi:Pregnancy-associated plasma protein-A/Secretion system C-terminal sorting domain
MSNKHFLTLYCLLLALPIFSQSPRKCGTSLVHNHLIQRDPSVNERKKSLEHATVAWLANIRNGAQNRSVITIPVVVHVVYATTAQNISDAQIQSQIAVLNQDYRKLNVDASNTPAFWKPLAADVEFQFCLASRTPSGAATNGITRTLTTVTSFVDNVNTPDIDEEDNVKSNAKGGETGWDPKKYLNIWICRLDGTILGYAYYPSDIVTTPELDGVVIDYRCFGTTGTAGSRPFSGFNKGRTTTHEIGHYFNLSHPWGDEDPNGPPCQSDYVSDTPDCSEPTYGCPTAPYRVGTACVTDANGQMFMNYMDYSNDNCLNLFTAGQAARMFATVNVERPTLITSNGCSTPIPVELISFEGKTEDKMNHLFWATASERENAYFEIQRSFDGQFFQKIGQIKGNNTTQERHNYTFDDLTFDGLTTYYRLNQVDIEGKSTFSNIVSLQNAKGNHVRIFPNPVGTEGVTVRVEDDGKKEISLQDVAGRTLFQTTSTDRDVQISTVQLASGLYFIAVKRASDVVEIHKLIVR